VTGLAGLVTDRDLRPGQGFELGEQPRLVALGGDQQVSTSAGDLVGVAGLGMQCVSDEDQVP
jgi:hypothetical protein